MSGTDPLVVEDWSAYEKSMLDVLREERRTRPKLAPVERPMSAEELQQFVQGKAIEPMPVESSISPAAPQAVVLPLSREQSAHVPPSTAIEPEAPSVEMTQPAAVALLERQGEAALEPATMEVVQEHAPSAAVSIASAQRLDYSASWWRVPLIVSCLVVAVAGGPLAVVKSDRQVEPAAETVVAPEQPVQMDASAPVNVVPESANDQSKDEHEVAGDRVRLRGAPAVSGPVLRTLRQGTAVTIRERSSENEWCRIEGAGNLEGWMKCEFLKAGSTPVGRPH